MKYLLIYLLLSASLNVFEKLIFLGFADYPRSSSAKVTRPHDVIALVLSLALLAWTAITLVRS